VSPGYLDRDIWAVVPIKELDGAKQRLAEFLAPAVRRELAEVMIGEVLEVLAGTSGLAGIMVVTLDPMATRLAGRVGARVVTEGARDGHTGSVTAGQMILAREGREGMLSVPGDIPCATAAEIGAVLAAHRAAPAFTIAPAHDDLGSNAVMCSPPDAVTLRFGSNSFVPHLDAARRRGIDPIVIRLPGIAMDVDHPVDLAALLRLPQSAGTRTRAFLEAAGVPQLLAARGIA
jgi:2-phospho-L-lactate guanylyltransferase